MLRGTQVWILVIIAIMEFGCGIWLGIHYERERFEQDAVAHGFAQMEQKNGGLVFQWHEKHKTPITP